MPKRGFFKPILDIAREVVAERFGDNQAEGETVGQLAAGGDTTATAIRSAMLFLLTNPQTYLELQNEIDTALNDAAISTPIAESEIEKLPYLQAVVEEALRIFPPMAMLAQSCNTSQDVWGFHIPAGINVELSVKPALRNATIYGQDANFFRPERWLEARDVSALKLMEETSRFGGPSRWECLSNEWP
ncbi:hypothetical protein JX265_008727 [Neoarthrinium moseri]|uniref:Cytochrome P450 n=1 Tax=Neoarthrinium moseri TaxID=1658444 RepID=A0A9Q0AM64_9PEZI|nr:uncharacterized protein JN550_008796 [Neoarthrinium moseri]KAI1863510.1 hypothetical protein JX265_008727 [Neoarthrinium moseri]KAI1864509.1 hypothetical protein JN550_008796 [Neoarthrinium moseri]